MNNEELKRLGKSVTKEMKKVKINLPLFELLKIAKIRDTFLDSLKYNKSQGSHAQGEKTHTQWRLPPNLVHKIQDIPGENMENLPQDISYGEIGSST